MSPGQTDKTISFVIPACNEQILIRETIRAIQESMKGLPDRFGYEIIVSDDGSCDDTVKVAEGSGAHVVRGGGRNIAAARNRGFRESIGEYLVFVDADTSVDESLLREMIGVFEVGAVWGSSWVQPSDQCPGWVLFLGRFYNFYYTRILACAYGCFFFVRRDCFQSAGGFPEAYKIGEDQALSRALTQAHGRLKLLRNPIYTSARKARKFGFWYHMRLLAFSFIQDDAGELHPDVLKYHDGDQRVH